MRVQRRHPLNEGVRAGGDVALGVVRCALVSLREVDICAWIREQVLLQSTPPARNIASKGSISELGLEMQLSSQQLSLTRSACIAGSRDEGSIRVLMRRLCRNQALLP